MVEIYDTDLPITVADKIITGTKPCVAIPAESIDMFSIDEIKEIVDYLMVYYESHKEGEANESD